MNRNRTITTCIWAVTFLAALVVVGCKKQSSSETDTERRLAEVEKEFSAKGGTGAAHSAAHVRVRVEGLPEQWRAGEEHEIQLVITIDDGWHINANPATLDYLIPTAIKFDKSAPVKLVSAKYPAGRSLKLAQTEQAISVYEGTVRIPVRAAVDRKLRAGTHDITARVMVQACDDKTCLAPSSIPVQFTLNVIKG